MDKIRNLIVIAILLSLIFSCACVFPSNQSTTTPVSLTTPSLSPTTSDSPTVSPSFAASQIQTTSPTQVSSSGKMVVHYINVGQGDSELIQFPSGKTMLIDAASTVPNYLRQQGLSSIDVVVATHPHEDHIGGMVAVLDNFAVKQFIDSGTPDTTSTFEKMLTTIDQNNIPFKTVKTGDIISLDPAVSIQVLNPSVLVTDDYNQNSIVLKMTYGKVTYLFTGDGEEPVEEQYANSVGHVDILKVAHHGSCTSSSSAFLDAVRPDVSVISVGAHNDYGHPCAATTGRLEQVGSKVYRTDQDGTIIITSDGNTYSVETSSTGVSSCS
ncbi:MAG: ComEC/Rec2 family competence protein, partial [Methanoregula sp.]